MKLKSLLIIIIGFLISCNPSTKNNQAEESMSAKLKKEAIALAQKYAGEQLSEPKTTVDNYGVITVSDHQKRYKIDPAETFTGLIDKDTIEDAIVSLTSFYKKDMGFSEQLIFINVDGQLMLMRSVENDMKILMLKDRIITAELHTKPRTSPLYNCHACKEIIDFQYENGDLVKLE